MAQAFILPDIGEGIVECEVVKWYFASGQTVQLDQAIVDVQTDKALVEIPSMADIVIDKLCYQQGDTAKVGKPLFYYHRQTESIDGGDYDDGGDDNEGNSLKPSALHSNPESLEPADIANSQTEKPITPDYKPDATLHEKLDDTQSAKPADSVQQTNTSVNNQQINSSESVLATPAVRGLAKSLNVDLSKVTGSGEDGRVLRQDLLVNNQSAQPAQFAKARNQTSLRTQQPLTKTQAVMANQMTAALAVPAFTMTDEVNIDQLTKFRAQQAELKQRNLTRISLLAYSIKALSLTLKKFDILNAMYLAEQQQLVYQQQHNIGIAMDTKLGLLVPVIANVEQLSVIDIQTKLNQLKQQSDRGFSQQQLAGATINVSNVGSIAGIYATPIVSPPQVTILAIGRIQQKLQLDQASNVVTQSFLPLSWSADHRVIDGATIAKASRLFGHLLSDPIVMLGHLA